jgi:hypothetical protein
MDHITMGRGVVPGPWGKQTETLLTLSFSETVLSKKLKTED